MEGTHLGDRKDYENLCSSQNEEVEQEENTREKKAFDAQTQRSGYQQCYYSKRPNAAKVSEKIRIKHAKGEDEESHRPRPRTSP